MSIDEKIKEFQRPDYGTFGQIRSAFNRGVPNSTRPGLSNNIDLWQAAKNMALDHFSSQRGDDGIKGQRICLVAHFETIPKEDIRDPSVVAVLESQAEATGEVLTEVLVVYGPVAGGTSSMLTVPVDPKKLPDTDPAKTIADDYARIIRYPRFYAIPSKAAPLFGHLCRVEFVDKQLQSWGWFHSMMDAGSGAISSRSAGSPTPPSARDAHEDMPSSPLPTTRPTTVGDLTHDPNNKTISTGRWNRDGQLINGVNMHGQRPDLFKWHRARKARQWANPVLINGLIKAMDTVFKEFPDQTSRIYMGDISLKDGGVCCKAQGGGGVIHKSHQNGLDIDTGFIWTKRFGDHFMIDAVETNQQHFHVEANKRFTEELLRSGTVHSIFLDRNLIALMGIRDQRLFHVAGHHHHYHIRFSKPAISGVA